MPENLHSIDLGAFTIQAPGIWKMIEGQSGDNGKGKIALDQTDTVEFNLGPSVFDISFYRQLVVMDGMITEVVEDDEAEDEIDTNTEGSRTPQITETYTSQTFESDVHLDVIDGMEVKILVPQKTGKGVVGVYFAHAGIAGKKFNLFGVNLKPENEKAFLAAVKTLKFHNFR